MGELAEHAQQQLLAVEAQIEAMGGESNNKSKKVLQGLAAGQEKALLHTCFTAWLGESLANKWDDEIRKKYEAQLAVAEKKLITFKEKKIANIKKVLLREAQSKDGSLVDDVFKFWLQTKNENKMDGDTKAKLKALQDKLEH